MASQPVSGWQYRRLNAAGTTVLTPNPTVLRRIAFSAGSQAGTVVVHDQTAGTAGTATQVLLLTARTGADPYVMDLDMQMQNGLVVETTGANDITVTWG